MPALTKMPFDARCLYCKESLGHVKEKISNQKNLIYSFTRRKSHLFAHKECYEKEYNLIQQ